MDVEGINYTMAMVAAGECCAILGENNLKDNNMHGIHPVRLKAHPVMNAFAVYRKDKYLSDPMSDLIELARDYRKRKSS